MIVSRRVVRQDGAVGVDECLQAGEIRIRVFFVIDLNAHAHALGHLGGIQPKLNRVSRQRLIPRVHVRDSADG